MYSLDYDEDPYETDSYPDPDFDIEDCAWDFENSNCELAGSEECEWECPFRRIFRSEIDGNDPQNKNVNIHDY
jgi:hypothetical protein